MSEISARAVKELRDQTGAGMMDCKKALTETAGDLKKAVELLRKKGIETAAKKADRDTGQGWIGHYVHSNGRIGVLVEVRCETDFVAKNDMFQEFVRELSMHIAAFSPAAVDPSGVDAAVVAKERELFLESDEVKSKPENIRDKIVDGKIQKYLAEICLLQQPWVKDDKKTVQEVLTEKISTVGENMSIARFHRMELGA